VLSTHIIVSPLVLKPRSTHVVGAYACELSHLGAAEAQTVRYLVSDVDKQSKRDDDEQVIKDANSSNDDINDLECKFSNAIRRWIIILRRGGRQVVPRITRQR